MKAHKVPAVYYAGWKSQGYKNSFYVYYTNALGEAGLIKPFKRVDKITQEHSYFMEEDFYEINLDIKGMEYKLETEITEFFDNYNQFHIEAEGDIVDSYKKYMYYLDALDEWIIKDKSGNVVTYNIFFDSLNLFVNRKVGDIVEKTYFAEYLEPLWVEIKSALYTDINGKVSGENILISKKAEFLEFFIIQYMRTKHYVSREITPTLQIIIDVFDSLFEGDEDKERVLSNGMFNSDVYFFGFLLDVAKGDRKKLNNYMNKVNRGYAVDILHAPTGMYYITSTSPCVIAKIEDGIKKEWYFPIDANLCAYFRERKSAVDDGNYIVQTPDEVRRVNNVIANNSSDIVISNNPSLSGLL